LQTHSTKFLWWFNGGGFEPPNPPSGYATESGWQKTRIL